MSPEAQASFSPARSPTVIGAIPARYRSSRLPGKALLPIAGFSLIERVYRQVEQVTSLDRLVVLTDDRRIAEVVEAFGGACELTPEECRSGTDRVAWAARNWPATAIVNVQGDEPLIDVGDVSAVVDHLINFPEDAVVTLATDCPSDRIDDPNTVKVVTDRNGYALYFSRAPIPHFRRQGHTECRQHVGVYGYQRQALLELASLEPSPLEVTESLEQLRALENGYPVRVLPAAKPSIGVDTEEDLIRVEQLIRRQQNSSTKRT